MEGLFFVAIHAELALPVVHHQEGVLFPCGLFRAVCSMLGVEPGSMACYYVALFFFVHNSGDLFICALIVVLASVGFNFISIVNSKKFVTLVKVDWRNIYLNIYYLTIQYRMFFDNKKFEFRNNIAFKKIIFCII